VHTEATLRLHASPALTAVPASIDALFEDIHAVGSHIARAEPLLSDAVRKAILMQQSFMAALAAVLATHLATNVRQRGSLAALIREVALGDSRLEHHAAADLQAVRARDPAAPSSFHVLFHLKGYQALQVHRVCHRLWLNDRKDMAMWLANAASRVFAVDIHPAARIGSGVMLDHGTGIVIGETAVVEDNVSMLQDVTLGGTGKETGDRHPKIRQGVLIGAGARILGNIEVGAMSRVAAGSIVLKNVPAHVTVAGVPARIVRLNRQNDAPALDMEQTL
jgi:serine O-acetyltransferase